MLCIWLLLAIAAQIDICTASCLYHDFASAQTAHDYFESGIGMTDLMPNITEAVKQATLKKMRVFGSPGHADGYKEYVIQNTVERILHAVNK